MNRKFINKEETENGEQKMRIMNEKNHDMRMTGNRQTDQK